MDYKDSDLFRYFKNLLYRGLTCLRKHSNEILYLVKIMMEDSDLPCF